MKTYTIEQIRDYLEGWRIGTENDYMLNNAIEFLTDEEDGIEAVLARKALDNTPQK
jgi:hypothetical protein